LWERCKGMFAKGVPGVLKGWNWVAESRAGKGYYDGDEKGNRESSPVGLADKKRPTE